MSRSKVPLPECKFCKRPMGVSARSYAENPFCVVCYYERVELAMKDLPPYTFIPDGAYTIAWRPEE